MIELVSSSINADASMDTNVFENTLWRAVFGDEEVVCSYPELEAAGKLYLRLESGEIVCENGTWREVLENENDTEFGRISVEEVSDANILPYGMERKRWVLHNPAAIVWRAV